MVFLRVASVGRRLVGWLVGWLILMLIDLTMVLMLIRSTYYYLLTSWTWTWINQSPFTHLNTFHLSEKFLDFLTFPCRVHDTKYKPHPYSFQLGGLS